MSGMYGPCIHGPDDPARCGHPDCGGAGRVSEFSLDQPTRIRAAMARAGIAPMQLGVYDDLDCGWVDPLDMEDTRRAVRRFLGAVWRACEQAEADTSPTGANDNHHNPKVPS